MFAAPSEATSTSLSEYMSDELVALTENASATARIQPFLQQPDAYLTLQNESHAQLPPLEWKVFRKSYTLLMWIRPVVLEGVVSATSTSSSSSYANKELVQNLLPSRRIRRRRNTRRVPRFCIDSVRIPTTMLTRWVFVVRLEIGIK